MFSPTTAHLIFFSVFFAAALPVLYYYRRRNPDPRFRPPAGEMAMITVFALFICSGLAFGLGSLFREDNDGRASKKKPNEGAGWSSALNPNSTPAPARSREKKEPRRSEEDNPSGSGSGSRSSGGDRAGDSKKD